MASNGSGRDAQTLSELPSALALDITGTADGSVRRRFIGHGSQLRPMRQWLATLLPPGFVCDDVLIVATELGSNAIRHTATGEGGSFTVELVRTPSFVRVAVSDNGGSWEPQVVHELAAEHGRGLLLVKGLSKQVGMCGDHRGRTVWAEIPTLT